jgi:parallel beta-helix repeat protein
MNLKMKKSNGSVDELNSFQSYLYLIIISTLLTVIPQSISAQDLIISSNHTLKDTTIILNGNLIVKSDGSLTLSKVDLKINSQYEGQYKIEVEPGGELSILDNCIIGAVNPDFHYAFSVHGSSFAMKNSRLSDVGWGAKGEDVGTDQERYSGEKGLFVGTKSAFIDSNIFYNNYVGVILADTSIIFSNNQVHSNIVHGIYVKNGIECQVFTNSVQHGESDMGSAPIRINQGHNNIFSSNNIVSNIHTGIIETFDSNGNRFENNNISGYGVGFILMFLSSDNIIKDNEISVDEAGIMVWGWNNQVLNNTITNEKFQVTTGIYMVYSYNSLIENNILTNIAGPGILLRHSSNNKICHNQVSALPFSFNLELEISGIFLYRKCRKNIIEQNSINNFPRGVSLFYECDSNYFTKNNISDIIYEGLILDKSNSNFIFSDNSFSDCGKTDFINAENYLDYAGELPTENDAIHPPEIKSTGWSNFNGHLLVEGQTVYFSNATVSDGDTLTLRNMTLITGRTGRTTNGVSQIELNFGGTLILNNCKFIHDLYGNGFVFAAREGSTLIMKDCSLYECGQEWLSGGIQIYKTGNFLIENNNFYGTIISLYETDGGIITGNKIYDSYSALGLISVKNVSITDNLFDGSAKHAISGGISNISIKNNTIQNIWGTGIHIFGTKTAIIEGNKIINIQEPFAAIRSWGENIVVQNNEVSNSYMGFTEGGFKGSVKKNKVSDCIIGMSMEETTNVEENIVTNCIIGIEGDILKNNIVTNCGIGLGGSVLLGNLIDSCGIGILNRYYSGKIVLATNNLISNCDTGIVLEHHDNIFHHNDIINNKLQAFNDGGGNYWDFEGYGNFWSNYTGPDENGDGIGDIPFIVPPGSSQDNFPLMVPVNILIEPVYADLTIESLTPDNYSIIPNPNSGKFTFRIDSNFNSNLILKLVNTIGQTVEVREVNSTSTNHSEQFDVSHLSKGIYHLVISTDKIQRSEKIVVQ